MTHDHAHPIATPEPRTRWYRTWTGIAGLGMTAAAALYLSLYHVEHVLDVLPFLLLLLCPLMHLFMHGGHGGGHGGGASGGDGPDPSR